MKRIKFPSRTGVDGIVEPGCVKLWQGVVPDRVFSTRLEFHDLELRALMHFIKRNGLIQYWDLVVSAPNPTL